MARDRLLAPLHLEGQRGLEIGALHNPILRKTDAAVYYVDHASTTELVAKYVDHPAVTEMVDVDVVWGDGKLTEALETSHVEMPLDFVLASHVIEHVPNIIGWLDELAEVLRPGGFVSLAIPDYRYCFDAGRRPTIVGDAIEAWLADRRRPTVGSVYDFHSHYTEVDTAKVWDRLLDPAELPVDHQRGLEWARKMIESGEYIDVHCWVFTPATFLELVEALMQLDLLRFKIAAFHDTIPGDLEFHVALERVDDAVADDVRRRAQLGSLPKPASTRPDVVPVVLSPRELRLVEWKRRAVTSARRLRERFGMSPRRTE